MGDKLGMNQKNILSCPVERTFDKSVHLSYSRHNLRESVTASDWNINSKEPAAWLWVDDLKKSGFKQGGKRV